MVTSAEQSRATPHLFRLPWTSCRPDPGPRGAAHVEHFPSMCGPKPVSQRSKQNQNDIRFSYLAFSKFCSDCPWQAGMVCELNHKPFVLRIHTCYTEGTLAKEFLLLTVANIKIHVSKFVFLLSLISVLFFTKVEIIQEEIQICN